MRYPKLCKLFVTAFSVCVLTCMLSVSALAGETEDRYGYTQLDSQVQKELYVGIKDGVASLQNPISFYVSDFSFTGDDLQIAADMVSSDYPEFFWCNYGFSARIYTSGLVELTTAYEIGGESVTSVDKQSDALMNEVEEILDDMPASADTDYEKALYLHDALAQHVTYVFTDNDQTAYGALVEGEAVCAGYARAYQLLLEKAGVKAWTVVGDSVEPNSGTMIAHAWTLMWLDDDCYYTDVTWDDQGDTLFHAFFSRSLEEFAATHVPNAACQAALPECAHNAFDYFNMEMYEGSGIAGGVTDSTAAADVFDYTKVLQNDGYTYATIHVWYTGSDFNAWLQSYLNYTVNNLRLSRCSCSCKYIGNEYQVTLYTGVGGVYTKTDDAVIRLDLRYPEVGLAVGSTYDLMVAYYTEDGQFLETNTVKATVGSNGSVVVSVECPLSFDTCKVFVPSEGVFVPLSKAITVMQK